MSKPLHGAFCNRTLNLRSIAAIGYDMDYTLVHYDVEKWERLAFGFVRDELLKLGWPVGDVTFDQTLVTRGLILDLKLGNIVKANRFGYVKRACHGTQMLSFEEQRHIYTRTQIDLRESRWKFLNTLFSISEGCLFANLVDAMDRESFVGPKTYKEMFETIAHILGEVHSQGRLKEQIMADPASFVDLDPEIPLTLLEQKEAGKKILLITNSEWTYAEAMMRYAFDPFLPGSMTWRDLFEFIIVGARKPTFFDSQNPAFEVISNDGSLRPTAGLLTPGKAYVGASASLIEKSLELEGEELLYIGDHLFVDVNVSKNISRWRTALVLRELEEEIDTASEFAPKQEALSQLMAKKEPLESELCHLRLALQQKRVGRANNESRTTQTIENQIITLRQELRALNEKIAPFAEEYGALSNLRWGLLMRAGYDKSHLARQVERYADIYMSRVSSLRSYTPYAYLRSVPGTLPHMRP